jgi:hypothetical protein
VDEMLAGSEYEAHYLTLNHQLTLSIWLVEPGLNPEASGDDLKANNRLALRRGVSLAQQVTRQIPCARQLFVNINPMIVDEHYNSWYISIIPLHTLLLMEDLDEADRESAIEKMEIEFATQRRIPPPKVGPDHPADACAWQEARDNIQSLWGAERRNTAAYILIGDQTVSPSNRDANHSALVQAQWDVQTPEEMEVETIRKNLGQLSAALGYLSPPVDMLEVFIVDEQGQLLVYAAVPGEAIGKADLSLAEDEIAIYPIPTPSSGP